MQVTTTAGAVVTGDTLSDVELLWTAFDYLRNRSENPPSSENITKLNTLCTALASIGGN